MLQADPGRVLRFDRYTLRPLERQLLRDGQALVLGSRAFDLLHFLAGRAGRTVAADELRKAVWPERVVADNNLRVQLLSLRKLLGDDAIVNIPSKGYRFTLSLQDDAPPVLSTLAVAAANPQGNLPAYLPTLFDREQELQRLQALLSAHLRVSVLGAAGVGKTAFAQLAALEQQGRFSGGVWWVELAALTHSAQVATAVAAALGVTLRGPLPLQDLGRALDGRQMLVVLDNCEHLWVAVTDLADALLHSAPGVRLMFTSRRMVRCAGEQLLRLEPLPLPQGLDLTAARRSGAVALFDARARRADPRFVLTAANVVDVVTICQRLDGLALAIELAASRVPLLGLAGLRERLGERLRLLNNREPHTEARHLTLEAALDWSHALLSDSERRVLACLGVFAGSFSMHAVQAVAADETQDVWSIQEALQTLIEQSLLAPDSADQPVSDSPRYTLHETVRLYARTQLDARADATALRHRHALHVLAQARGPLDADGDPVDTVQTGLVDADLDNLRTAITWGLEHDIELALQLASGANSFFRLRGHHQESRRLAARLLAHPQAAAHPRLVGRLRLAQCAICFEQNDLRGFQAELAFAMAALQPLRVPSLMALCWGWASVFSFAMRQTDAAEAALQHALPLHRAAGKSRELATTLNHLASNRIGQGRAAEARPLLMEALSLNQQRGSRWSAAVTLQNLGEMHYALGDLDAARRHWLQAQTEFRDLRSLYHGAQLACYLGLAARRAGQWLQAHEELLLGLASSLPQRFTGATADAYIALAGLAAHTGRGRHAAVLLCLADCHRPLADALGPVLQDLPAISATVRAGVDPDTWHAARAQADRLMRDGSHEELLAFASS